MCKKLKQVKNCIKVWLVDKQKQFKTGKHFVGLDIFH